MRQETAWFGAWKYSTENGPDDNFIAVCWSSSNPKKFKEPAKFTPFFPVAGTIALRTGGELSEGGLALVRAVRAALQGLTEVRYSTRDRLPGRQR
jgi:hypothetical protein